MQVTYDQKPAAALAGMIVDVGSEMLPGATRSAHGPAVKMFDLAVATVQNSTLYRVTVSHVSKVPSTYGNTLTTNIDFTSDGSATKAEILAGVLAQIALTVAPVVGALPDAALGPVLLSAKTAAQDFSVAVSANLTATANAGLIPFGRAVVMNGNESRCRLPEVAADIGNLTLGVARHSLAFENNANNALEYPINSQISILRKGRVWVKVLEAVLAGDDAFVCYEDNSTTAVRGGFRKSGEGVAQVTTLTPTAANATPYSVAIGSFGYDYLSDGTATATEVVTDLLAQINLQTALHGVTATGTATLILTGAVGVAFSVSQSANMAAAATTPVTANAARLPGAKFMSAASTGGIAILELNL